MIVYLIRMKSYYFPKPIFMTPNEPTEHNRKNTL